jgi:antiviral helicase SKI2
MEADLSVILRMGSPLQVEDMLKRSFAEFHAQRAAPEAQQALAKGRERLAALAALPWPGSLLGTKREEVARYHALSQRIEALSAELQARVACAACDAQREVP